MSDASSNSTPVTPVDAPLAPLHDDLTDPSTADAPKGQMAPTLSHANAIDPHAQSDRRWASIDEMLEEITRHVSRSQGLYADVELLKSVRDFVKAELQP